MAENLNLTPGESLNAAPMCDMVDTRAGDRELVTDTSKSSLSDVRKRKRTSESNDSKVTDMFAKLSATISGLSAQIQKVSERQDEQAEMLKRRKVSESGSALSRKRVHHVVSDTDDEADQCVSEAESSDGEIIDKIDELLNSSDPSNDVDANNVEDEFLTQIATDLVNEDLSSPAISEQLADILIGVLSKNMSEDKIKEKMEKFPPPKNISLLNPPKVNPEVWNKIKPDTRSRDIRFQRAQCRIVRGLTPLAQLADKLLTAQRAKNKEAIDLNECITLALNSFALVAIGNTELSYRRRELIRPDLNASYRELCGAATPVTNFLFGDEFAKAVKEINETNRVATKVLGGPKGASRYANKGKANYRRYSGNYGGQQRPKNLPNPHFNKKAKVGAKNYQRR